MHKKNRSIWIFFNWFNPEYADNVHRLEIVFWECLLFFPPDLTVRFMMKMGIPYRPWIMTETRWTWEVLRLSLTTSTLCITHQRKGDYHHHFCWRHSCWTSPITVVLFLSTFLCECIVEMSVTLMKIIFFNFFFIYHFKTGLHHMSLWLTDLTWGTYGR